MDREVPRSGCNRPPAVWTKVAPHEQWTLVMKGYVMLYWAIYALRGPFVRTELPIDNAEWADWDHRGRLVFTRQGKLFAGELDATGGMTPRELADFNADTFEPKVAPAWAREW